MEFKKLLKKTLLSTCVFFTVITAAYMLILQIANLGSDSAAVESERVLLFFIFALLFSIANAVKGIKGINQALGYVIHYAICTFGFYACFLLPVGMGGSTVFTGIVIFTLLYIVIAVALALFSSKLKANREVGEAYNTQFKKKK